MKHRKRRESSDSSSDSSEDENADATCNNSNFKSYKIYNEEMNYRKRAPGLSLGLPAKDKSNYNSS